MIDPEAVIESVTLRTNDASRLADFYRRALGLIPQVDKNTLVLRQPVTNAALLVLAEDASARPSPPGAPGLFHIAFCFATFEGWRRTVASALAAAGHFHGASDHGVSWAVYMEDPDGNGLELAWDKPEAEWPRRGEKIAMFSRELPLGGLLSGNGKSRSEAACFHLGHIHLQVHDLSIARTYEKRLGVNVTQSDYPGAVFLARGRYHHHLAVNNWRTGKRVTRPENPVGLMGWRMKGAPGINNGLWRDSLGNLIAFTS